MQQHRTLRKIKSITINKLQNNSPPVDLLGNVQSCTQQRLKSDFNNFSQDNLIQRCIFSPVNTVQSPFHCQQFRRKIHQSRKLHWRYSFFAGVFRLGWQQTDADTERVPGTYWMWVIVWNCNMYVNTGWLISFKVAQTFCRWDAAPCSWSQPRENQMGTIALNLGSNVKVEAGNSHKSNVYQFYHLSVHIFWAKKICRCQFLALDPGKYDSSLLV